jgi:hypothetical protein
MASNEDPPLFGIVAEFANPGALFRGCEKIRDAGFKQWDAHSPFPVHGLDRAMGLGQSHVSWVALASGLTGASLGMLLQWWVSVEAYPLVISGKPLFSWQAFIPITFELGVLFAALGSVAAMLHFNRLPRWHHPVFNAERFDRMTDDRFFISIEAADPRFELERTQQLLRDAGATHLEVVNDV